MPEGAITRRPENPAEIHQGECLSWHPDHSIFYALMNKVANETNTRASFLLDDQDRLN